MAKAKPAKPSGNSSARPRRAPLPQPHGGALIPGAGGGPQPGSGRPPEAFRNFLARLRADPKLHAALRKAARDPDSKGFASALKVLTDYDSDKPAEKHTIVGPVEVRVKFVREGRRVTAS